MTTHILQKMRQKAYLVVKGLKGIWGGVTLSNCLADGILKSSQKFHSWPCFTFTKLFYRSHTPGLFHVSSCVS